MATKELRKLLHRYRAAYTTYLTCVHALSDACQGRPPKGAILESETSAFDDLATAREQLLEALEDAGRHFRP